MKHYLLSNASLPYAIITIVSIARFQTVNFKVWLLSCRSRDDWLIDWFLNNVSLPQSDFKLFAVTPNSCRVAVSTGTDLTTSWSAEPSYGRIMTRIWDVGFRISWYAREHLFHQHVRAVSCWLGGGKKITWNCRRTLNLKRRKKKLNREWQDIFRGCIYSVFKFNTKPTRWKSYFFAV